MIQAVLGHKYRFDIWLSARAMAAPQPTENASKTMAMRATG